MILSITSAQWSDIISDDDVGMIIRDHTYFIIHTRGGSGNLKMVRPLTDNGFNGGGLARCNIKLHTA